MNRLASAAAAALAVAAVGVSIPALRASANPATTKAATTRAATAAPRTAAATAMVMVDCLNKKVTEPRTFTLACADGNALVDKLTWTSWTPAIASAAGVFTENDCTPYCAAGHFHSYPILAVAWGSKAFHGSQRYTELTIIFTGNRPAWYANGHRVQAPPTVTYDLTARP